MIDLSYIIPDNKARNMKDRTEERKNRFNGESVMLTKEEARKHDQIFIDEITATIDDKTVGHGASKHWIQCVRVWNGLDNIMQKLTWYC